MIPDPLVDRWKVFGWVPQDLEVYGGMVGLMNLG